MLHKAYSKDPQPCLILEDIISVKDTVSTDKEDDEENGDQDARKHRPSIGHYSIVHY